MFLNQKRKRTRTRTARTKRRKYRITQFGGRASQSNVSIKYKPQKIAKIYKTLTGLLQYTTTTAAQLHTDVGQTLQRQYSSLAGTMYTGTDYGAVVNTYRHNVSDADPWQDAIPTTTSNWGDLQLKPLMISANQIYEFINQTESTTWLDIYTVMAKTTGTYESPITTWTNAMLTDAGTKYVSGSDGVTGTINFPGDFPQRHKQFNMTWKTIKKHQIELLPGVVHKHSVSVKLNRIVDYEYMSKFSMVKGITYATFIVCRGTPADNTLGMDQTPAQVVTYAPVKIDWVLRNHYNFKLLQQSAANHWYNNQLGNLTYGETYGPLAGTINLYQQNQSGGAGPANLGDPNNIG